MSINKNSAGFETIFEIATTSDVAFTNGVFKSPNDKTSGFKLKSSVAGTVRVHYQGDASDRFVDLVVGENDVNVWLSDRIDQVLEAGLVTITASNLIVGY